MNAQPTQVVRTTLHLSPAVSVAAFLAAQRRRLRLREWLDQVMVDAVSGDASDDGSAHRVLSDATASLFACLVSVAPERLEGRWRLLYERVRQDDSLWSYPRQTLDDVETGRPDQPVLDEAQLRRRWPELVAAAFLM